MADSKITGLTSLSSVAAEDLLVVVDDPSGTPTSKQVTVGTLFGNVNTGLKVNGSVEANTNGIIISTSQTPASASATGTAGTVTWDSDYVYVCTATNTWKRAALSTW